MATDDKPKLQRTGKMQDTAQEGIAYCEKGGLDWRKGGFMEAGGENLSGETEEAVQNEAGNAGPDETAPAPASTKLERQSTMAATAKEGKDFIERMGGVEEPAKEKESGGKTPVRGSHPKLQRDSTIDVTVREAEQFLNRSSGNQEKEKKKKKEEEEKGNEQNQEDEEQEAVSLPQVRRDLTMKETAKIGEEFIGEQHLTGSRNQTKLLRESERTEAKRYRRASLKRTRSMDVTAAEGEEFVKRKKK